MGDHEELMNCFLPGDFGDLPVNSVKEDHDVNSCEIKLSQSVFTASINYLMDGTNSHFLVVNSWGFQIMAKVGDYIK